MESKYCYWYDNGTCSADDTHCEYKTTEECEDDNRR